MELLYRQMMARGLLENSGGYSKGMPDDVFWDLICIESTKSEGTPSKNPMGNALEAVSILVGMQLPVAGMAICDEDKEILLADLALKPVTDEDSQREEILGIPFHAVPYLPKGTVVVYPTMEWGMTKPNSIVVGRLY